MLNFEGMIKPADKYHIYAGCYIDLIMGTGLALSYIQVGDKFRVESVYKDSCTINLLELTALVEGMESVTKGAPFVVHTGNRYIQQVLLHASSWRNQGCLETKAHPYLVKRLLDLMDSAGTGQVEYSHRRDDMMTHLIKYAKHLYQKIQTEMIDKRTTSLPARFFETEIVDIKTLPGSIIWKTPFSIKEFEKKMAASRNNVSGEKITHLKLIQ